jgi:hypothetical protein
LPDQEERNNQKTERQDGSACNRQTRHTIEEVQIAEHRDQQERNRG